MATTMNPHMGHESVIDNVVDHSAMDHSNMDHSNMDHSAMDHSNADGMNHAHMNMMNGNCSMGHGMMKVFNLVKFVNIIEKFQTKMTIN